MTVLTHAHGGDLDAIQRTYGIPKEEIIDFSGNINPLGFPKRAEDALKENLHLICTYPDKKYKALKQAIGTYTGADPSHIVVGNGSTELISTFIQTVHAKHSIIMGPAYSEYEREVSLGGGKFEYFPLKEEEDFKLNLPALLKALTPDVGMFVACNPNNPTGTAIRTEEMRQILAHCKKIGASVMIDETYIEFSDILPEICSIPLVKEFDNLFVIRGTSKFFAAPGSSFAEVLPPQPESAPMPTAAQSKRVINFFFMGCFSFQVFFSDNIVAQSFRKEKGLSEIERKS